MLSTPRKPWENRHTRLLPSIPSIISTIKVSPSPEPHQSKDLSMILHFLLLTSIFYRPQPHTVWQVLIQSHILHFLGCTHGIWLARSLPMLPSVLPLHPMAVVFPFSFSNLIIPLLILRRWGQTIFCSNQNKPRTREHGWAHAEGAGKSRP